MGLLVALLWLGPPRNIASAHALLVRSSPAAGAELATAPAAIDLWFSEPLETRFSTAHLVDAEGKQLADQGATVDPTDPTHLTLTLATVPPGVYTVVYHTLSQADGHEWLGSFPLTILNADGTRPAGAQLTSPPATDDSARDALPTPLAILGRWLALMGALLLFGVVALPLFTPTPTTNTSTPHLATAITRSQRLALWVGLLALIGGAWLQVLRQILTLSDQGGLTDLLLRTRTGNLLLGRQLLAILLLLFIWPGLTRSDKGVALRRWLVGTLGVGLLLTFSIGSHAAATVGSGWAILGDFVHLAAAALWLGGLTLLATLFLQLRTEPVESEALALRQMVHRFSTVATLAVYVLLCTGLFSTLVQLQAWELLWSSSYGWLLLAKLALVGVTLAIALLNHRLVRGRATEKSADATPWTATSYRRFTRQLWSEALVGLAIMVVVAVLVQTPIPQLQTTAAAAQPTYFETLLTADDLTIHLQISPNQVGDNRYVAHLYHADNSAIGKVQLVRLSFTHQTAELGQATLELAAQGGGLFSGAGAYQNLAGPWDITLYVRRRGMDDLLTTTTVEVPAPGANTVMPAARDPWQNPIPALSQNVVAIGALLALGVLQLLWYHFTMVDR